MEYGCIAEKLSHSFSKEIHSYLAPYSYELREIPQGGLDAFMKEKSFKAINVTIPYKQDVIPYLDEISETAEKIGAVNTIVNRNGKLYGYNTDFFGMKGLILSNSMNPLGKKALILGTGGTSKTAAAVLEDMGAREIYKLSRRAQDGCITYEVAYEKHLDAEVIINTTPVGMYPNIGVSPIDISRFNNLSMVVDAVYNPLPTKLISDTMQKGIPAVGGLYMLVAQAARACEFFIDTEISEEKISEIFKIMYKKTENIVLTGMPGAGKSTIGKRVSEALGMDFVDSDDEIVKKAGRSIPEIFADSGEDAFRDLESEVIKELSARKNTVIATGGGAVLRSINTALLRENGKIYFLDRPLDSIRPTSDRPTALDREALEKRYRERYGIYTSTCDVHIEMCDDVEQNTNKILEDFKK